MTNRKPDPAPTTYFQIAQQEQDITEGQYARERPHVIGTGSPPFPAPRYAVDQNVEPPLGFSIDDVPDMTVEPYSSSAFAPREENEDEPQT